MQIPNKLIHAYQVSAIELKAVLGDVSMVGVSKIEFEETRLDFDIDCLSLDNLI